MHVDALAVNMQGRWREGFTDVSAVEVSREDDFLSHNMTTKTKNTIMKSEFESTVPPAVCVSAFALIHWRSIQH